MGPAEKHEWACEERPRRALSRSRHRRALSRSRHRGALSRSRHRRAHGKRGLSAALGKRRLSAALWQRRTGSSQGRRRWAGRDQRRRRWAGWYQRRWRWAGRGQRRHSWAGLDSGPVTSQTPVDPLSPTQSRGVWEIHRALVICPEPKQMEDSRVVELRHRGEPAEFSGELHEGEIPPAKGEGTGCELHRREGESVHLLGWIILSRCCTGEPGTRRRGCNKQGI